jgi:hypothetical protein
MINNNILLNKNTRTFYDPMFFYNMDQVKSVRA